MSTARLPRSTRQRIAHRDVTGLIDLDRVVVIGANERRRSAAVEAIAGGGIPRASVR